MKRKDHAQDGETLIANEISGRRSCHGLWISDGVHPLGSQGHLAPAQRPDCCWTLLRMIVFRKSKVRCCAENHAKTRAKGRAW